MSDIAMTYAAYVAGLEAVASEFVRRCEIGEVRSKKSYAAFKAALSARPDAPDIRVVTVAQLDRWFQTARPMHGSNELDAMATEIRAIIGETKP